MTRPPRPTLPPLRWLTLLAPAACLAAGCTIDEELLDGTVSVSWQVGTGGCAASGVTDVDVQINDQHHTVPCEQGELTMEVAPGDYRVFLWGLDADGVPRYEGSSSVLVLEGEAVTVPTVVLGGIPASIDVTWYFENGRLCGGNGIDEVEIVVFDDDFIVTSLVTACDDGIERIEDLPSGAYTISVLGRDETGTVHFQGDATVEVDKGDLATVEVMLSE